MTLDQLMEAAKPETERAEAIALLQAVVHPTLPGFRATSANEDAIRAFLARIGQ